MALGLALATASLDLQLRYAWEPRSPAQIAAISECCIAHAGWPSAEHRWGLKLACTTWKPQSLCTQSTATDHVRTQPPCPCMANLPWRVEVGGQCHSQSLQLTGLGKSLPLTCQQQSKLNYKRRVHPTHMKEPFQVPSLAVPLDLRGHLLH